MRILRGLIIAIVTAFTGCILAFFVGDYLTRLAHVPEMEGQRGMTVFFLCVPLGIIAGLVIGITVSIWFGSRELLDSWSHKVGRCWFFLLSPAC